MEISYSKFVKLKPKNVLPVTKNKYLQCLYEYCINTDFQVKSMSRFCAKNKIDYIATDKYELSRLTLCEKENGYYKGIA